MAIAITHFDGNTLNSTSAYRVGLPYGQGAPKTVDLQLTPRRGTFPVYNSMARKEWRFPVRISGVAGAGVTYATFRENVEEWFSESDSGETRELRATWHDGTAVRIMVRIESLELIHDAGIIQSVEYIARCVALTPYWEANSASADSATPVPNNGNATVYPSLALTCSTHAVRKRFTVTGAGRGGGLKQCPIRFEIDSTALTASNAYCLVNGVSVPFYVGDAGLVTSFVWALVDTPSLASSSTTVDIVYATGISNPLAGALLPAGRDWSNTGSSNTVWKWDDLTLGQGGSGAGVWRPALIGTRDTTSVGLATNTSSQIVINSSSPGLRDNDMDAIELDTGGIGFSALDNVSRTVAATSAGTGVRASVRTQDAGSSLLATDWSHTSATGATVTTSITLTNGVKIVIAHVWATSAWSFTLEQAGGTPWALTLADTPTVTLVHTQNLDLYNGPLVIGPTTVTFTNYMTDDGTLTIEHGESGWSIVSSVAGYRFYGPENRIVLSDPDVWLQLLPGSNVVSNSVTGASWTLNYRHGYSA